MASDLTIAMGNGGTPTTWYLTSTKSWFKPIDIALLPGDKPAQPVGIDAVTVTYSGNDLLASTLYFGRVFNSVDAVGERHLDVVSFYNDVKNVQAIATGAEKLFIDGLVHADVMVGTGTSEGSVVTLNGAKRGNVITGAGDDQITVRMASNGVALDWVVDFRINSGAGNDRITLAGLDIAAEIAAGDRTFERAIVSGLPIIASGQGRVTWTDAGAGDDVVIGWDSRDNIIGGTDGGRVEQVGGATLPSGFAYTVGGSTGRGCPSVLYKVELATGKTTAVGEVQISLGKFGSIGGLDMDSLALNPKDGMLYGFATKLGLFDGLVRIDPATGATSLISLNLKHLRSEQQDIAFDKAGKLYFVTNGDLLSVDTATGKITTIGNNTLDHRMGALAIDPTTDKLYGLAETGSKTVLVEIDKGTGKALAQDVVAGLPSNSKLEGMSFDVNGTLWAVDRVSGKIATIDVDTYLASYQSKTLGVAQQTGDGFEALAMAPGSTGPVTDVNAVGGDRLTGGAEADHFWYKAGDGVDTITDFQRGTDRLHIAGYDAAHIRLDVFNGDTVIRFLDTSPDGFVDNALIVLEGVSDLLLADLVLG